MRRQLVRGFGLLAAPILLALWLVAAPTALAGSPCFHGYEMPAVTAEATNEIKMAPCAFGPTIAQVPTGSTVKFFNGPEYTHLITGANQAWGSPDVEVRPDSVTSYSFDAPGIYAYACALHPGMSGAIVVGDVANVLAAGTTGATTASGTPPAAEVSSGPPFGTLALVAAGTIAGLVVGAGAVWLGLRRRSTRVDPLVRAD